MARDRVGSVLEALGLMAISVGFGLWELSAGLIACGVGLVLFGLAVESAKGS